MNRVEKVLSIVIPSYNVAKHLPNTIPTFLSIPDELLERLEIIIVNDGSKDNTLEVAEQLQLLAPRVINIIDKENGGHGSTINAGIDQAQGKYFKVVDGDDFVDSEQLANVLTYLQTVDVDQVISPFYKQYTVEVRDELVSFDNVEDKDIYQYDEFLKRIGRIPEMHSVINKTSLLKDNQIRLSENCFYVDMQYNVFPMRFIQKVAYFDATLYQYQMGDENQSVSARSYLRNKNMHEHVVDSLIDYVNENVENLSDLRIAYINQLIRELVSLQINIYLSIEDVAQGKKEYKAFMNYLKVKHPLSFNEPYRSKAKLLKHFPFLFGTLSKWYQNKFIN